MDFPKPGSDDLFYLGASLNLADGGDFSNPLIVRQEFPSHFFFVYPPLHSFALAGWLKMFGINSAAMTAYAIFSCLVVSIATIFILRRHQAPAWLEWLVPLGVCYGLLPLGLRAEPFAAALVMGGFAIAEAEISRRKAWALGVGLLLIFLGGSAAPRITIVAAALVLRAGWHAWISASRSRQRWGIVLCFLAAFLITGISFLLLIDFRVGEFLHTFHYFAAGRVFGSKLRLLFAFLFGGGYVQLSLPLLFFGLLIYAVTKPTDELSLTAYFVAATLPVAVVMGTIGSGTPWWMFLVIFLLAGSALKRLSRSRAISLQLAIALVALTINRKAIVQGYGLVSGHIKSDRGEQLAAALKFQPTPEHPIVLDGWVARYVYDYRLPPGALDLASATKFPGMSPGSYPLPASAGPQLFPGDMFIVGNVMLHNLKIYTYLEHPDPPKWAAFGLKQLSFEEYPRWAYLIPSESCRAIRSEASMPLPADD